MNDESLERLPVLSSLDDDVLSHYQLPVRHDTHAPTLLRLRGGEGSMIRTVQSVIGVFNEALYGKRIINTTREFSLLSA